MNTKKSKKEYIDNGGVSCPYPDCGKMNIVVIECIDDKDVIGSIKQTCECHDCGRSWEAYFTLSRVVLEDEE